MRHFRFVPFSTYGTNEPMVTLVIETLRDRHVVHDTRYQLTLEEFFVLKKAILEVNV
jgi:hypothetical protein